MVSSSSKAHPGKVNHWIKECLDLLLPRHCVMCGLASGSANICAPCSSELPRIVHPCSGCGLPLIRPGDRVCGRCLRRAQPWDCAIAALVYEFPVNQLIRRFKFHYGLACGQVLALELSRAVRDRCQQVPDVIVPVPLHRSRVFARPYNQSEILARRLGKALELPVHTGLLRRIRRTRAHSGLDRVSRRINIRGAFGCNPRAFERSALLHAALVDDVLTTGATLAECTRTLRAAGCERVSVWVAARAPAVSPSDKPLQ